MFSRFFIFITLFLLVAQQAYAQIVFETDFENDGNFFDRGTSQIAYTNLPEGWDGIRTNQGTIMGVPGAGVGGSVAMKFEWPGSGTNLATSLFKHLTGDENTGYPELYVRYRFRLPDTIRMGKAGSALAYWKWGRFLQNTGLAGDKWTENRVDSGYVVWAWGSGLPKWGTFMKPLFAGNFNQTGGGSADTNNPKSGANFYTGVSGDEHGRHIGVDGAWDNLGVGALEFDHGPDGDTRMLFNNTNQDWHTIEWRYKLSSTNTANDGVWQMWFDGVEQIHPNQMPNAGQAVDQPSTANSLITAANPGYNFFILMDNNSGFANKWDDIGVEGGIYINDVVISTSRIGPNYFVGDPPPNSPTDVLVQ